MGMLFCSCDAEKPPPGPVSYESVKFKKVGVWVEKENILGHFGLVNEKDQDIAMAGQLTLSFYAESNVNVQGGPAFNVKSEIGRSVLAVKVSDFKWVYYHSFLTKDDFICKFYVPLSQFKSRPPGGRYIQFKINFKPDLYPTAIEEERQLWIPND